MVLMEFLVLQVQRVHLVTEAQQDLADHKDLKVLKDIKGNLVCQVPRVSLAKMVLLASLDHKEQLDYLALKASKVFQGNQVDQEKLDLKDPKDQQGPLVKKVDQVTKYSWSSW